VNNDDDFEELPQRETAWQARLRRAAYRKDLLAADYHPLPCNGKAPPIPGWQDILATPKIIDGWNDKYPEANNTGILTRDTPAIDLDILDEEIVEELEVLAEDMLGKTAGRTGRAPKRALLFRTDAPFHKMTETFTAPNGTSQKIEILGNGQQIVVDGVHPETGGRYTWRSGEPGPKLRREDLPMLTAELAAQYMAAAVELMKNRGYVPQQEKKKPNGGDASHAEARRVEDPQAYALGTLDALCEELAAMPPGSGRNAALNKAAWKMAPMVRAGWITRTEVETRLYEAACACGLDADPNCGPKGIRKTIKSGLDSKLDREPPPQAEAEEWEDASSIAPAPSSAPLYSDEDLALRFADRHGADLRYVAFWGRWVRWLETFWQFDDTLTAFDLIRTLCRSIASECKKKNTRMQIASARTIAAVERLGKADRRIAADVDQWNTDRQQLNVGD